VVISQIHFRGDISDFIIVLKDMKYTHFAICLMAFLFFFSGCKKESVNSISVTAKPYNGSSKAYVNSSHYLCWNNGDAIRLIGGTSSYDGQATISISHPESYASGSATTSASGYEHATGNNDTYAAYPWSIFNETGYNRSGNVLTFNMPSSYDYEEVEGHQVLSCPMVAKTVNDVLTFTNLCSLIELTVPAPTSGAFVIDQIQVESTGAHLSGAATVDVSAPNPTVNITGTGNTITMNFATDVPLNGPKTFYIPIPPLASDATLTIKVRNKMYLPNSVYVTKTITSSQHVPGNQIIPIAFSSTTDAALSGYTFGHYIQNNSASCYINLGVAPDNTSKMEMTFEVDEPTNSQYYSGSSVAGKYLVFAISGAYNNNYFSNHFFDDYVASSASNDANSILRTSGNRYRVTAEVKKNDTLAPVGDVYYYYLKSTFEELDPTTGNVIKVITKNSNSYLGGLVASNFSEGIPSIYVFGFNTERRNPGMKLYSYKIWNNGNLVYNFVPATRTSDSKAGVYNMGSASGDRFITGTGSFTVN